MKPEIKKFFDKRTKRHISLVQKYCGIIDKKFPEIKGIVARGTAHDASKYSKDELEPYVWLMWQYKCKDDGVDPKLPKGMQAQIDKATEHHILNNAHHPEFHQSKKTNLLAKGDRDGIPDESIDATQMSDLDIAEMVADWCAMSEERGNSPKDWADKVVNKRWRFTPEQTKLIYKLIGAAWKGQKKMRKTANQIADEVLEKCAWAFGPWGSEAKNFKEKAKIGDSAVKKEYLRLRDLAAEYPKMGNKTKFKKFKEEVDSAGGYSTQSWERAEPRTLTGLTGIR